MKKSTLSSVLLVIAVLIAAVMFNSCTSYSESRVNLEVSGNVEISTESSHLQYYDYDNELSQIESKYLHRLSDHYTIQYISHNELMLSPVLSVHIE